MCDAPYNNLFCLGLTGINEVHRRIYYIPDGMIFSSAGVDQTFTLKYLQGKKI